MCESFIHEWTHLSHDESHLGHSVMKGYLCVLHKGSHGGWYHQIPPHQQEEEPIRYPKQVLEYAFQLGFSHTPSLLAIMDQCQKTSSQWIQEGYHQDRAQKGVCEVKIQLIMFSSRGVIKCSILSTIQWNSESSGLTHTLGSSQACNMSNCVTSISKNWHHNAKLTSQSVFKVSLAK